MSHITVYCLGFAFYGSDVILVKKDRPAFQKGLLNGVGGKVEAGEHPLIAMIREFEEETRVQTFQGQWKYHGYLNNTALNNVVVHVFYTELSENHYRDIVITNSGLKISEVILPINIYDEINLLEIRNLLMHNVLDIVVEISDIIYKNDFIHQSKRNLNRPRPIVKRVENSCLH